MEKIEAKDVNFYYGDFHALKGISMEIPQNQVHLDGDSAESGGRLHRSFGLRQVHFPAAVQPDERPDTRYKA